MRLINPMIPLSGGDILLGGRSVLERAPTELRREIGYVIQQIGLFPHLTVSDNIATVPKLLGWERARTAARVRELIELIGMDPEWSARATRRSSRADSASASVSPARSPATRP
jgi:osmoprotectant transport system ATP-binding protein